MKTLKNAAALPEEASKCSYFHKIVIKTKMVISWRARGFPNILKFWKIQSGGLYLLTGATPYNIQGLHKALLKRLIKPL